MLGVDIDDNAKTLAIVSALCGTFSRLDGLVVAGRRAIKPLFPENYLGHRRACINSVISVLIKLLAIARTKKRFRSDEMSFDCLCKRPISRHPN